MHTGRTIQMHQQGYTLLEMLVVVALVSIVLAIGVSSYSGLTQRVTAQNQAEQFRGLIRDGATLAASRSLNLTLNVASGTASLKNGTTTLRSARVNSISTGLTSAQTIAFDNTGRVVLPGSTSSLTVTVNGRNRVLQVSGIGQTRWQQ
ncbi:pilus assembly FimT family protein [Deinococcus cellulosilyticus]|uniref:Prepilin-type N-terminal cleavage/methylation domain-containing protein n=1 Tax=Deinococcus cellulosilyticus (strain DSM 18568 / NBRC 106333 / KACC 11606 / 5516J-15) TaxID=1223518 RepID=A0A511NAN8_DEIC1|nr:type II secretion system protein [Deinococcus cellulosilyticus]GEM49606.1 hypothetical protein DC3_52410 [Deinococcus cellulosilyticus NBRC 106333 = KACC 11606]